MKIKFLIFFILLFTFVNSNIFIFRKFQKSGECKWIKNTTKKNCFILRCCHNYRCKDVSSYCHDCKKVSDDKKCVRKVCNYHLKSLDGKKFEKKGKFVKSFCSNKNSKNPQNDYDVYHHYKTCNTVQGKHCKVRRCCLKTFKKYGKKWKHVEALMKCQAIGAVCTKCKTRKSGKCLSRRCCKKVFKKQKNGKLRSGRRRCSRKRICSRRKIKKLNKKKQQKKVLRKFAKKLKKYLLTRCGWKKSKKNCKKRVCCVGGKKKCTVTHYYCKKCNNLVTKKKRNCKKAQCQYKLFAVVKKKTKLIRKGKYKVFKCKRDVKYVQNCKWVKKGKCKRKYCCYSRFSLFGKGKKTVCKLSSKTNCNGKKCKWTKKVRADGSKCKVYRCCKGKKCNTPYSVCTKCKRVKSYTCKKYKCSVVIKKGSKKRRNEFEKLKCKKYTQYNKKKCKMATKYDKNHCKREKCCVRRIRYYKKKQKE